MDICPIGMIGGLGMVSPLMEKKKGGGDLEELLLKVTDLYPDLIQEKESAFVRLLGSDPHLGQIKVEARESSDLQEALNHLFLATTVASDLNQVEKKEFEVKAFVWTAKTKSLTLSYKGISATLNIEGYVAEGAVKLSKLIEEFKSVWQEARRVKELQQGYSKESFCRHSFKEKHETSSRDLFKELHSKC
jgi:hypothetical protein